jgi:hypothetical protein
MFRIQLENEVALSPACARAWLTLCAAIVSQSYLEVSLPGCFSRAPPFAGPTDCEPSWVAALLCTNWAATVVSIVQYECLIVSAPAFFEATEARIGSKPWTALRLPDC